MDIRGPCQTSTSAAYFRRSYHSNGPSFAAISPGAATQSYVFDSRDPLFTCGGWNLSFH